MSAKRLLASVFALTFATIAFAEDAPKPKFGPEATPIFQATAYLREAPAPDYWTLSPFYIPQRTTSDCSPAAIAMVVNALRGLPANADQELVTENSLMAAVGDQDWMVKTTEDGSGVTFEETTRYLRKSLDAFDLTGATITRCAAGSRRRCSARRPSRGARRKRGSARQRHARLLQPGRHHRRLGRPAHLRDRRLRREQDRVLIMDVDRNWYVPYWTSTETLLAALVKPIAEEHVGLAGGTGGYFLVSKP